ncbi:hypothetical protein [Kaistella sp.]|uniref:hypothetical protein n=1 Tax=Kaistella sp. TaxID=2782235 RepID=UPI003C63983F
MRKNILFLLLIALLFSCKKKDENLNLKYEVLNQLIADDIANDQINNNSRSYLYKSNSATNIQIVNLNTEKLNENTIIFNSIELKNDSIFSSNDIDYLIFQTVPYDSKQFDLDKGKIYGELNIIKSADLKELQNNYTSPKDYWAKFQIKFGDKCIRNYSEPIFNLNKNICIVKISESCGPLEGGGSTSIFQKVNGKWKVIKTLDRWVS